MEKSFEIRIKDSVDSTYAIVLNNHEDGESIAMKAQYDVGEHTDEIYINPNQINDLIKALQCIADFIKLK